MAKIVWDRCHHQGMKDRIHTPHQPNPTNVNPNETQTIMFSTTEQILIIEDNLFHLISLMIEEMRDHRELVIRLISLSVHQEWGRQHICLRRWIFRRSMVASIYTNKWTQISPNHQMKAHISQFLMVILDLSKLDGRIRMEMVDSRLIFIISRPKTPESRFMLVWLLVNQIIWLIVIFNSLNNTKHHTTQVTCMVNQNQRSILSLIIWFLRCNRVLKILLRVWEGRWSINC